VTRMQKNYVRVLVIWAFVLVGLYLFQQYFG
jgi:hypothetical protein